MQKERNAYFIGGDFSRPKLVYAELARTGNAFAIDKGRYMVGNSGYVLTTSDDDEKTLLYLLAFLNSRTTLYCLNQITSRFDENGWRWLRQFVEQLRVPMLVEKERIVETVAKADRKNQHEASEAINAMVANIYHFTKEEEAYINAQLGIY